MIDGEDVDNQYLLLRDDFNQLIEDIRIVYISKNYIGLISWLIDRAFCITNYQIAKQRLNLTSTTLNTNRSLLLKVLYEVNPKGLLACFSKNVR